MLSLPPSVRILLAREPADMRKGFDGLSHLVESVLQEDPLSGHLFVFRNRRGDRIKLLLWDSDGFLVVYCTFRDFIYLGRTRSASADVLTPS
jgi:transposase